MSDIEKIKKLRQSTGAGFKDCNAALKESGGDLDKAAEVLRVKGIAKASKKMSRDAKEGVIAVSGDYGYVTSGNKAGKVYKFELSTNAIIDSVDVGNGPEQLIITDGKIITANSGGWINDSTIAIIDLETFKLDSLIEVGSKPADIAEDKNGFIWVLASGQYDDTKAPKLVQINPMNWSIEKDLTLGSDDESISKMTIDKTQENIFYYK